LGDKAGGWDWWVTLTFSEEAEGSFQGRVTLPPLASRCRTLAYFLGGVEGFAQPGLNGLGLDGPTPGFPGGVPGFPGFCTTVAHLLSGRRPFNFEKPHF